MWNAVGGDSSYLSEHNREHDCHRQRLEKEPERAEDRLLVSRHEITAHEKVHQVPIPPQPAEIDIEPGVGGTNYRSPALIFSWDLRFRQDLP